MDLQQPEVAFLGHVVLVLPRVGQGWVSAAGFG